MNLIDKLLCEVDTGLRTLFATPRSQRPWSGMVNSQPTRLGESERQKSIRLMRINHTGEICAQALYQGQAFTSRQPKQRVMLEQAAKEEIDHLAWCATRLGELGGNTSRLTPFFYVGSFALGIASGLAGDQWSMGFLVETERQVEAHLDKHLQQLPPSDERSRQILASMREDEIKHAQTGLAYGGVDLPSPIRAAMHGFSRVMTTTTYWV
ncbi:MAG: 2-polyprenyl-3-methyl-6-methoxy-1,4-benzoquinone monooxygenase [Betaproteobacteria bacterium]|nr:2-polyprenyl-3-methyl-6-methoxy-1,4-benzoquinone monooxygenase [Betaproteobacteria bacterium]